MTIAAESRPRKPKKCGVCKEDFKPKSPMQKVCGIKCAVAHAEAFRTAEAKRTRAAERRAIRDAKQKAKTRGQWLKEAQAAWNFYVRMRDYGKPCASCGAMPDQRFGGTMDCSHYRSVGAAPHLRFHLHNAAAACVRCNRHLSGNVAALRVGMISRIGVEKIEAVEADHSTRKFDVEYLKRIKKIFTKKAYRIKKVLCL